MDMILFFSYEKYSIDGQDRFSIAGYATVYQYYAYPANIRPRVSQVSYTEANHS